MRWFPWLVVLALSTLLVAEEVVQREFIPTPIGARDFDQLKSQSPFTRSIVLSDSLILMGIATMNDEKIATLMDKETKETFIVSSELNPQGWKLVELKTDEDLDNVFARVAVENGEVVTVQYADRQLESGDGRLASGSSSEEVAQTQETPVSKLEKKNKLISQLNAMQEQLQILEIMNAP